MPKLTRFDRFMMKLCVFRLFARTPEAMYRKDALKKALAETADALESINEKREVPLSDSRTPDVAQ